jgi:hypothetical protein
MYVRRRENQDARGCRERIMAVNNFDVLKQMSVDNLDIRLATSENILNMKKVKAGTQLTFGVSGDVLNALYCNDLHCCLLIWDKKQFNDVNEKLESQ